MAVRLVAAALCLLLLACPAHAEKIAFVGATVVNPVDGSIIQNSVVVTDGDNIKAVGTHAQERVPADARRIDAAGKFIIPGLWQVLPCWKHCRLRPVIRLAFFVAINSAVAAALPPDTSLTCNS